MKLAPDLLAYIGEDEFERGYVGIKQAMVPAGFIPIVAVEQDQEKITRPHIIEGLQQQVNVFHKPIRLIRYVAVEEIFVLEPKG